MSSTIRSRLNLLITISLLILVCLVALLFIIAPLASQFQHKSAKSLLLQSTSVFNPAPNSSLYPLHKSFTLIQPYSKVGDFQVNHLNLNNDLYSRAQSSFDSQSDWVITNSLPKQGNSEIQFSLSRGGASFFQKVRESLNYAVNPAQFQLSYYTDASQWLYSYRELRKIANNTSLYYIALQAASLHQSPTYFSQFNDLPALLQKYSLTQAQFIHLNNLVTFDYLSWSTSNSLSLHVHSHSLLQYCLGYFPGHQSALFQMWKDAIDTYLSQTAKGSMLLNEGCIAIRKGKQYLHSRLCSLHSNDCQAQVLAALNYNATLVRELITHIDNMSPNMFGLAFLLQNVAQPSTNTSRILDILLKNKQGEITLETINSERVRCFIKEAIEVVFSPINMRKLQQFKQKYQLQQNEQINSLRDTILKLQKNKLPNEAILVEQVLGQQKYKEDLQRFLLHYVAQLFLNYAETIKNSSTKSCEAFLSAYIANITAKQVTSVCEACSSESPFIQHCLIEYAHYPALYSCDCNFTAYLTDLTMEPLMSKIVDPFEQYIHFKVLNQFQNLFDCRQFTGKCPPLVVALNELNSAILNMGSFCTERDRGFEKLFSYFSTVSTFPEDNKPSFYELPYLYMIDFLDPWADLDFREMWDTFFQLLVQNAPQFSVIYPIPSSFSAHLSLKQGYSPDLLYKAANSSIGNICSDFQELTFLPLSLNLTFFPSSSLQVPISLASINSRSSLQYRISGVDETLEKCSESWLPISDGFKRVEGSLGFIIDRDTVLQDSIFVYNNYIYDVLQYDAFPCPQKAQDYLNQGMRGKCFILNTAFMNKDMFTVPVHYLWRGEVFGGDFAINLPGYCGMEEGVMYLPHFKESLGIDCFEEQYDQEHLSKKNWLLVDEITGIVLYSHLQYFLSGTKNWAPRSPLYFYPLLEVREQVTYNSTSVTFWKENKQFKEAHSWLFWNVAALLSFGSLLTIWMVRVRLRMREAKTFYSKLT